MLKKWLSGVGVTVISVGLATVLAGCGGSDSGLPDPVTSYGAPTAIGNGTGRTFIRKQGNTVLSVGIEMTDTALQGLPVIPFNQDHIYTFAPPPGIDATAIQGITMDYTDGHVPVGAGDVPHFHPSFFLISDAQKQQITIDSPIADAPVSADETPTNHIALHMVVPTEGAVYFDPILPGYRESPFTTTNYNYNFFNGHMVLIQTGVAVAFLNSKQEQAANLELPRMYPHPGLYPSAYRFKYDLTRRVYLFTVEGFVSR